MGLFGGSKSSSTTNNIAQDVTRTLADYSQVDGAQTKAGADIIGDNNQATFNVLDGGAISGAFTFGESSLDTVKAINAEALAQIGAAGQRETETAMFALKSSAPDTAISSDLIKYGALVIAVVALVIVSKWGKS